MVSLFHIAMARELAEYRMRDVQRDARRRYPQEDVPGLARVLSDPLPREDRHQPERQVTRSRDGHSRSGRRRRTIEAVRGSIPQGADHDR